VFPHQNQYYSIRIVRHRVVLWALVVNQISLFSLLVVVIVIFVVVVFDAVLGLIQVIFSSVVWQQFRKITGRS
jgi:hypothetical protein